MLQNLNFRDKISIISGLVLTITFIGLGISLIVSDYWDNTPRNVRVVFGVVIIIYGVFKAYRVYSKLKERI